MPKGRRHHHPDPAAVDPVQVEHLPDPALALPKRSQPATKDEMGGLFEHLERELDACGFLRIEEKRPVTVRNLRNIFQRAGLTDREVRMLRGVIAGLTSGRGGQES